MSIDFTLPYTTLWQVNRVNPKTWKNVSVLSGVKSISLQKDASDDYPLLETGSMDIDLEIGTEFNAGWYRVEALISQDGEYERVPISTLYYQGESYTEEYSRNTVSVSGVSALYPASDKHIQAGDYAPKGSNGMQYVIDRLKKVIPAPISSIGNGFTLNDNVVFDLGSSEIEIAWSILDAGNHVMQINGRGEITVLKRPEHAIVKLNQYNPRMVYMDGKSYDYNVSEVPNVYYAIDGYNTITIRNENLESKTSVQNRGWEKDYIDDSPVRVNGETLDAYAKRRLIEESTVIRSFKYKRQYDPNIHLFDLVEANVPGTNMHGSMRILSQSLTLGTGISVEETAGFEIKEYSG